MSVIQPRLRGTNRPEGEASATTVELSIVLPCLNEASTLSALRERRKTILEPVVKEHGGRVVKVMGDGVLVEFASAVSSVRAAIELQSQFAIANESLPEDKRILLRIGINLGDVIHDERLVWKLLDQSRRRRQMLGEEQQVVRQAVFAQACDAGTEVRTEHEVVVGLIVDEMTDARQLRMAGIAGELHLHMRRARSLPRSQTT